ncbi:hypothetical protein SS1G_12358 [Sclerotinia sclerotiorum 1980 UF-70]|uniref:Uncharacterized protein n=2 Tax=Sclerotinia sclerotiorum (strain ATCC 18683 / 1980 / Ss-1) TaxID=665079 RepID=A7F360_SCLS1|nr:hypothetical protein SS1G_12358 [Sclerotinia sclerotiorum 1980 UF-70]APA09538.1 hypothetical protein sscle_05g043080 [Sclerotinia sclerotiorum 1980 UF-70]EDN96152.1 hypothetical protein SS1G_12358 [Sclerotinia sclerotiorum 1980 UF-70]
MPLAPKDLVQWVPGLHRSTWNFGTNATAQNNLTSSGISPRMAICVRNSHGFLAPRSRGDASIKSKDPAENPTVNRNYLENILDMLMFSEGCRMAD